jgi:uncharacterized membrane protein YhhN
MIPGLVLYLVVASLDWVAVRRGWKRVELAAKPAAMLVLFGTLAFTAGFTQLPLLLFGIGLLLCLAGDVFINVSLVRISNRWFLAGLGAFLLAHVAYIASLNIPLAGFSIPWGMVMAVVLALAARRTLGAILGGIRKKGLQRMVLPVTVYGVVITLMVLSAMLTMNREAWGAAPSALVSLGAVLFYFSDILLAWNRYVQPVRNGRFYNMILYHLGQGALLGGMLIQFSSF